MKRLFLGLMLILGACTAPPSTPTPTSETALEGRVAFTIPQVGTVYYAETLTVAGTAENVPASGFVVRVYDKEALLLAESVVYPKDGTWLLTLPLNYTGETQNIEIVASSTNPQITTPYATTSALLSTLAQRPEGVYGTIFAPTVDEVVGGEQILVNGTVSGLFEAVLTVTLLDNKLNMIDEQSINVLAPSPFDEAPFEADLTTNGYTGPITIRISYISPQDGQTVVLDEVSLMLGIVAG